MSDKTGKDQGTDTMSDKIGKAMKNGGSEIHSRAVSG
jgi:hypothetical protein